LNNFIEVCLRASNGRRFGWHPGGSLPVSVPAARARCRMW
jgi:hypothetical protein